MSYLVLARKYRPQTFDDVVGQKTVTRTLKNAIATGRIGHAFLLSGARGVGKTTTARLLAKALNCAKSDGPTPDPCNACTSCLEIAAGSSLDVQEIDGASNNSVDNVRELRESARYNPARDRFKIWIIDEVHQLSGPAFNALLKTLEEPPPKVKFIFATTEYHKIPDTILSRCQQYDFRMIPTRELLQQLRSVADREGIQVADESLVKIARAADGSARDALSLFDQVLSFSGGEVRDEDIAALLGLIDRELLLGVTQAIAGADSLAVLAQIERLSEYGADYRNFTRELMLLFRELLLVKLAPEDSPLAATLVPEERERLQPLAAAYSEEDLLRAFEVLTKVETDLRWAQDPRVTLEFALLKLAQMRKLVPLAELVGRVERLAGGAAAPPRAAAPLPAVSAPAPRASGTSAPVAKPTAAAPPEAAEPPAGGEEATGGLLPAMLAAAQVRPSLLHPLRNASARLEKDVLVLEVLADFAPFVEAHIDDYRELASKAAGRALRVQLAATKPPSADCAPEESSPGEVKKKRLLTEASREPAVQEALELFKGKVVDVREA
jgi:DNA polymerase-3 subunit gamma/tau